MPDVPGCFSAGRTLEEALVMAKEAIAGHLETLIEFGEKIPAARPLAEHMANPEYAGGVWAVVDVDTSHLAGKAVRINISMNERVLAVADDFAKSTGDTRSGLLQRAVTEYVANHRDIKKPARGRAAKTSARRAGRL